MRASMAMSSSTSSATNSGSSRYIFNDLNKCISLINEKLTYYRQKYAVVIIHLVTMIGITVESALYIIGEIGTDMSVWRDNVVLSSWAGLFPANNDSTSKKKSTKIGNGGHYLNPLFVQCALAAVKGTKKYLYFYYKYQALKKRRGHKKAVIVIARKMPVAIYHMIRDNADFLPVNHEETVACSTKADKGLNLTNINEFLGEHGTDAETLQLIKASVRNLRIQRRVKPGYKKPWEKKSNPYQTLCIRIIQDKNLHKRRTTVSHARPNEGILQGCLFPQLLQHRIGLL